jgi:predicted  nucleic acid-binding Zn-ribbon protein
VRPWNSEGIRWTPASAPPTPTRGPSGSAADPHRTPTPPGAPLKADAFSQLKLLDVQELDSRLDQLRHQLRTLPEAAELAALAAERTAVDDQARDARVRVDDLTREQRKADADVEQVKARRKRDQDRMDAGQVSNPKDLERMQSELVSLERRIGELEDLELEVMERLETAQAELDELTARVEALDARAAELTRARDAKAADLTEQLANVERERGVTAEGVPADLLTLYTKVRDQKGGVGAAPLRARRCGGCSLELTAADLGVIAKAPTDEVLRCEECNRILVRTSESGI